MCENVRFISQENFLGQPEWIRLLELLSFPPRDVIPAIETG